ncbi:hypothetical protein SAMN05446635_7412 [Burkholderia sp. OK233]|nr:hypothetical protein SAMN05446635_7412 [Burkholderia sp. OK233]
MGFALHSPDKHAQSRRRDQHVADRRARLAIIATLTAAPSMKARLRYLSALVVNVAFPWLAYRLAFPHYGQLGALVASALPLIAWMSWDLVRYRHFDALSAIVLVGIVLSLLAMAAGGSAHMRAVEDPMVSGMIGASFLVSLALPRPLVYYLGRSTRAREDHRSVESYEKHWRERPTLVAYVRLMTLVWGLGVTGENLLRSLIIWQWPNDPRSELASVVLRYGAYAGLTAWTFWCRQRLKQDAMRYPADPADPANATDRLANS